MMAENKGLNMAFIERTHSYVSDYVRFADTKAGLIMAAAGVLLAFPLGKFLDIATLIKKLLDPGAPNVTVLTVALLTCVALFVGGLALAFVSCARCLYPRLGSNGKSPIFFGDIAACESAERYIQHVRESGEVPGRKLAEHVYDLSRVCCEKYRNVKAAIVGLLVALTACASSVALMIALSVKLL